MSETVIKVENLSKYYRLGVINHGVFYKDLQSFIAKIRGKEDPNLKIDQKNNKNGWIKALDNISFDVKQGEILGIIGSNGAGKSTLLKILSRVTAPSKGTIKIKGRIGSLLEVGTGFHPELTGRENIFLNGAILGMKKREIAKKLDEIIDFSGVEKFIDTPVKRYSSGMYVRLAFAVAAHLEPEILVVDEVLAVGDAEFQKKCLGKMGDVAKEGRTVLFVSHNMGAVKKLCQKGILLKNGKIEKSGKIKDVIDDYSKGFVSTIKSSIVNTSNLLEVQKFLVLDVNEKEKQSFAVDELWIIKCTVKILQRLQGVVVGVSIKNSDNFAINTSWSKPQNLDTGVFEISFVQNKMFLAPGEYYVNLGISFFGKNNIFYKENLIKFTILEYSNNIDIVSLSSGIILNQMEVRINNLKEGF